MLEEGLKEFSASMDANERWKTIASNVPDKTKKQCVARFKALKAGRLQGWGSA
ncbi:hypothetical protein T484DRAFT_1918660 [Baffinella frigidus]|nr:hypothetical protein T484DRAFT_1918660 [Cryptophyta sp. CCMP2293]